MTDTHTDMIAKDLGPWADTSTSIIGRTGEVGTEGRVVFGVALRNDLAQPWVTGRRPLIDLGNNPELSGSAIWSGRLLGVTPQAATVAGAADLTIHLSTLTGDLDFTDLESWAPGHMPDATGTGTLWGDGDLNYQVGVRGNAFGQTGGDDGTVTGVFVGSSHEGMGGTLVRDDLTGAFGGTR